MDLDEFAYDLPERRIAQQPLAPRDAARLLVDCGADISPQHHLVSDLPVLLQPGDLLVINDTRVLHARLRLQRASGAAVELLLLEALDERRWQALVRPARRVRAGEVLQITTAEQAGPDPDTAIQLVAPLGEGRYEIRFLGQRSVEDLLAAHGEVPLPPYITEPLTDPDRYQTVFARRAVSVAAPTAGLHLTQDLLGRLAERGVQVCTVELAVGLGTFRPITAARVEDHVMHEEAYRIPEETLQAISSARSVVAVGTTVVRTLETYAQTGEAEGRSSLFIRRPFDFAIVDRLLTNFHVPRSSLLVMIDAFIGPRWRELYETALAGDYRFLSFGDAMLLSRASSARAVTVAGHAAQQTPTP